MPTSTIGRRLTNEAPEFLLTENETNQKRLFAASEGSVLAKDAFHDYLVHGQTDAVAPERAGTKAAAHYALSIAPGATVVKKSRSPGATSPFFTDFPC